ncbi:FmdB family zinc ribbon protein [Candidatus Electrothrix sp.]|uniref:FmdB family zinc ribbon protein n=1 Tax=Candidatus Electrothrix sp. TaxID=2170559 RepID=UPI004055C868
MPIYEYVCKKCTKQFEVLKTSSNDNEPVQCPDCESSDEVHKTISSGIFRMSSASASIPCGPAGGCPSNSGFS